MYLAIILIPILLYYLLFLKGFHLKTFFYFLPVVIVGAAISLYQWLSTLIYSQYLFTSLYPVNAAALYYPTVRDLLYSPWRYGFLFQGPRGEISHLIGILTNIYCAFYCIFAIKRKIPKTYKNLVVFYLSLIIILILLMCLPRKQFG